MDMQKNLLGIAQQKFSGFPFLEKDEEKLLLQFCTDHQEDVQFLYDLNGAVLTDKPRWEGSGVAFEIQGGLYKVRIHSQTISLLKNQFLQIIRTIVDTFEHILPLGSVVELKKEYLGRVAPVDRLQSAKFVITHRFIYGQGDAIYFPYAGVVYPLGTLGKGMAMHFTAPLIERVIQEGYTDEQEEAFVFMMKKELILDNDMHSYAFSTEEERKRQGAGHHGGTNQNRNR